MKWLILLLGLSAMGFGGWWGWLGWSIVQVERGWSAVIAGAAIASSGLLMVGLAAVMARVDSLIKLMRVTASSNTLPNRAAQEAPRAAEDHQPAVEPIGAAEEHQRNIPADRSSVPEPSKRKVSDTIDAPTAAVAGAVSGAAVAAIATHVTDTPKKAAPQPAVDIAALDRDINESHAPIPRIPEPEENTPPPPSAYEIGQDINVDEQVAAMLVETNYAAPDGASADVPEAVISSDDKPSPDAGSTAALVDKPHTTGGNAFPRRPLPVDFGWPDPPEIDSLKTEISQNDEPVSDDDFVLPIPTPRANLPKIEEKAVMPSGDIHPPAEADADADATAMLPDAPADIETAVENEVKKQERVEEPRNGLPSDPVSVSPPDKPALEDKPVSDDAWLDDLLGTDTPEKTKGVSDAIEKSGEDEPAARIASEATVNSESEKGSDPTELPKTPEAEELAGDMSAQKTGGNDQGDRVDDRTGKNDNVGSTINNKPGDKHGNNIVVEKEKHGADNAAFETPERELLRSYESQGVQYYLYADGSIDAHAPNGDMSFSSLEELRAFFESRQKQAI